MRLQDHIDFTTLQWVKPELDVTLSFAREALESYVDNPGNRDVMRSCASSLHQVLGTLRMVELYGAAMVAEEMETLVIALLEDHVKHREEAYAALMRGLMQLPDYLERLSSGHRDVPVVLLPLLNELRASRDREALPDSVMFHPDLDAALPDDAPVATNPADAELQRGRIAEMRLRFQQQLLAWFRGQNAAQQLLGMRDTLLAIAGSCYTVPGRRLWWISAGVIEGLEQGMLKTHAGEARTLIGKIDRHIRQLIEHGENGLRGGEADELAAKLLYVVAQARPGSAQMNSLRTTYQLDSLLPAAGELEHARGSMTGHNRALLDSVSRALKDDLLRVKEALDLFLRQAEPDPAQLAPQSDVLERVGDTLGMLALAVPRRVINEQRRVLDEVVHRIRAPEEGVLLDIAGALLYVEASLDDHIESLGAEDKSITAGSTPTLPRSEARHILASLMQEAIGNTGRVKEAVVGFIESGWQHDQLRDVPALMDEVSGAIRMLGVERASDLAEGIGRFVSNELLTDRRVPGNEPMDHLADALAALDYYLEAAREHRGGLEHILDVAERSLGALGYWPLPQARALVPRTDDVEIVADNSSATPNMSTADLSESVSLSAGDDLSSLFLGSSEPIGEHMHDLQGMRLAETQSFGATSDVGDAGDGEADLDGEWIEVEEDIDEVVPVADELSGNAGFQLSTDGIDDDIRDIFLEEMQEEIDNLRSAEQVWLADTQQLSALISIRRSFHTLKGSGRLVGASVLGEFAWKVENMLNRVLDVSIQPHAGVKALLREAIQALPQLLGALKADGTVIAPLSAIMQAAEQLAAGEMAQVSDYLPLGTQTVRRTVRRRVPRLDAAASAIPSAAYTDQLAGVEAQAETLGTTEGFHLPVMPFVDPVLLEILRSEVAQYLQAIRAALHQHEGELRVDDGLLRAVHTLHGAIAMVDIAPLTQLLSPLESLLKRLRAAGEPLSIEGTQLLGQAADVVDHVMAQFDAADPQLPDMEILFRRVSELRDGQPEPQVAHVVFEPHADELRDRALEHADLSEPVAGEAIDSAADAPHPFDADSTGDTASAASEADADEAGERSHDELAAQLFEAMHEFDAGTVMPVDDEAIAFLANDAASEPELSALLDRLLDESTSHTDEQAAVEPATPMDDGDSAVHPVDAPAHATADEPASAAAPEPDMSDTSDDVASTQLSLPAAAANAEAEAEAEADTVEAIGADKSHPERAQPELTDFDYTVEPTAAEIDEVTELDQNEQADTGVAAEANDLAIASEHNVDPEASIHDEADEARAEPASSDVDRSDIEAGDVEAGNLPLEAESPFADEEFAAELAQIDAEEAASAASEAEDLAAENLLADAPVADAPVAEESVADELVAEESVADESVADELADDEKEPHAAAVDNDEDEVATAADTAGAAQSGASSQPGVSRWVGQIDPDLLEVFSEEAAELLDHAGELLAQWRVAPTELELVPSLQRDLHTLKGGARIAGLVPVGDLTHAIETLLGKPIGHDPAHISGLIGTLESGFDQLHTLVHQVNQGHGVDYPQAMIDRLLALAGEEALVDNDDFMPATTSVAVQPVTAAMPAILLSDLPELLPEKEEDVRGPQEQIRVRAELLDSLVNHAGEVAIYRSRLEQQVAGYRANSVELEQTVARLRSQLRMLEIETEAQIIARFQHEHRESGLAAFDPLELDRFSQLQQYSRALAESVSDLVSIQNMLDELTRQAETLLIQQSRVSSELQEGLLRTRMLPFDTMVPNLRRTLRQSAQEQGKTAQLYVEGAHGEMDRNLLDRIKAPFEHMLRNAIAHGIESPSERRRAGKPAEGAVRIRVAREATEVVIRVSDDGRGLDRKAISKRAIERGLLRKDAKPSDDQLLALITQTGFSTAATVTQLSGRGVGMDVVASEIKQLGGSLAIESIKGRGTTFVLRLPFTLAVTQAILVRIGEATFAIPMTSVQGVARISPEELAERMAADEPSFPYGGEQFGIHDLAELLGLPLAHPNDEALLPLLLTRAGDLRAAIRIDAVLGSREIVVKSVGPQISSVPGLLGATIMGDGSVLIILDLAPLVRHGITRRQQRLAEGLSAVPTPVIEDVRVRPLVMVVDDSITMRKVTGRVLERHEYEVSTAKDGIDAIEKLHDRVPDMMLLDIEMPRMDGYELATHMKADPRLRDIPIIMITSRSGEKHRQRAFDIGVDRYLGKPYQEAELLAQITEVLEQRAMGSDHG